MAQEKPSLIARLTSPAPVNTVSELDFDLSSQVVPLLLLLVSTYFDRGSYSSSLSCELKARLVKEVIKLEQF